MKTMVAVCGSGLVFALVSALVCVAAASADDDVINVHVVPHTHDDVGWLKTVDEYYSGANNSIQHAGVRYIITAVVQALQRNPERKFTYVELAFFQRWWREQDEATRAEVKKLVDGKQLQFANGGWCMHDEAASHYVDMVDQTTLGHRFLSSELGYAPSVGWQIDPFGHSASQAALLSAEVGFKALFFGRIDYQDLSLRRAGRAAEMVWRASPSLGSDAQVFAGLTGEYGGNYGPPGGFNWEHNDEPVEDNANLDTYNVDSRVADFVSQAEGLANMTQGSHVMFTMGSDFNYENAEEWYTNMDKIIAAVNDKAQGKVRAFYSTPADYADAKAAETANGKVSFPLFAYNESLDQPADFFPYADGDHKFWTGYFTSRTALKRYIRHTSGLFTSARQAHALAGAALQNAQGGAGADGVAEQLPRWATRASMEPLAEALAVAQHHDAVSGTAKQHVTFDYAFRIARGVAAALESLGSGIATLRAAASGGGGEEAGNGNAVMCQRLNESVCEATQSLANGSSVEIVAWNPLAQARTTTVRVPVSSATVSVTHDGKSVPVQVYASDESVAQYARDTGEGGSHTVAFQAKLPPVGSAAFVVSVGADAEDAAEDAAATGTGRRDRVARSLMPEAAPGAADSEEVVNGSGDIVISNENVELTFDSQTGLLTTWRDVAAGTAAMPVEQSFCYYRSAQYDNGDDHQHSGAYIFRPNGTECHPIAISSGDSGGSATAVIMSVVQGPLVKEVRQRFADWLTQTVRLEAGARHATFEYTVGPIPIDTDDGPVPGAEPHIQEGREIVSRFSTPIKSGSSLFTDSNGREMLHRWRNFRPSWELNQTEPVAGNYFPCNAAASLRGPAGDDMGDFTILVGASQGVASLAEGAIEAMVHRRILVDDSRGVGEPLNETQFVTPYTSDPQGQHYGPALVIRGKHHVVFSTATEKVAVGSAASVWRPLQDQIYGEPALLFQSPSSSSSSSSLSSTSSALSQPLPPNVQLMTLEMLEPGRLLLRLSHQFGVDEDADLSKPVTVDLASLFSNASASAPRIQSIDEVSLTANMHKSELLARRRSNAAWSGAAAADTENKPHPWRLASPIAYDAERGGTSTVTLGPLEIKTFIVKLQDQRT